MQLVAVVVIWLDIFMDLVSADREPSQYLLDHLGKNIIIGCAVLQHLPRYNSWGGIDIGYGSFIARLLCPEIVYFGLFTQRLDLVPDTMASNLGKEVEHCLLVTSGEPVSCHMLLPRDIDQVEVPWQRFLLNPDQACVINCI